MKPTGHRRLFNCDCNFLFATDYRPDPSRPGPYTAEVLHSYVDRLAASGIDTTVINVNGQRPWYPSRAVPSILEGYTRGDTSFARGLYPPIDETFGESQLDAALAQQVTMLDRFLDLQDAGIDWVSEMSTACRRNNISPWASFRMNDTHGSNNWGSAYFNCEAQRDPGYRLKGVPMDHASPTDTPSAACDYSRKEVRDYHFDIIREIVEEYDVDGIELDWNRMPYCCNPPAREDQIEMMLSWTADIRRLTQRRAERTGKPCYMGVRVPARLDHLLAVGLDVVEMARRDLIDFVIPANQWQMVWDFPLARHRAELGEQVAFYGSMDDAATWMPCRGEAGARNWHRLMSCDAATTRGSAASLMANGFDGIEVFNFFCTDARGTPYSKAHGKARYDALEGMDDLDTLRGKQKHYALQSAFGYWMHRYFEFAEQIPTTIDHGCWKTFELPMCNERPEDDMQLTVQLVLQAQKTLPRLGIALNRSWSNFRFTRTQELLKPSAQYREHIPEHTAYNYRFDVSLLENGWNRFVVYHESNDNTPPATGEAPGVRVVGLEVLVTPG